MTLPQYLRERRLERAEELLRTTFMSIKEVGMESGLPPVHFVQYFKRRYGMTPSAYRKRLATFVKQ